MFMSPGKYTEADMLYEGQDHFQLFLLVIAVTAVPFLLIPKPLLFYLDMKKEAAEKAEKAATLGEVVVATGAATAKEGNEDGDEAGHAEEEEGELGEVIVHQVIHTIEFVLGSISNTASYLRLWALSLAHSQLAELFKDMILRDAVTSA
jgi:V-type H+-transporting ATPase subunit a